MVNVVRNPYRNCQAKNPETCRYHSQQFKKIEELKSSISDFFQKVEEQVTPTRVLTFKEPETDSFQFWENFEKMVEEEAKEIKASLYRYADDYGSRNITYLLLNPDAQYENVERMWKDIKNIDYFVEKYTPLRKNPHTVYRGVKKIGVKLSSLKQGSHISFQNFLSTSTQADVAKDFTDKEAPVVLEIKTKKGAPLRMNFSEYEYLLPRDSQFRVTSIEENVRIEGLRKNLDGVTIISLEDL